MRYWLLVFMLVLLVPAATLRAADEDALQAMAQRIADQISAAPKVEASDYSPAFLKAVPAVQLAALCKTMFEKNGAVTGVTLQARTGPLAGKYTYRFADVDMPVTLSLEPGTHRVEGLWFSPPVPQVKTLDEVVLRLGKLPGKVSFQLQRLGDGKVLASVNPETPLAIGSTFKLYILATLVNDQPDWEKVVKLEEKYKSLPSGEMQNWPRGSPVTVHTLALKMISQSDNTATDHLLAYVGREKVEKMLPQLGLEKSAANVPFLSTLEMFRLKADGELRKKYLAADAAERRAMLAKMLGTPAPKVTQLELSKPVAIDTVEWFAIAGDLCRVMAQIALMAEKKHDDGALSILAVNHGISEPAGKFTYVGFKGGSEPGVLNLTWLLTAKDGQKYALSAGWNDTEKVVEEEKLIGLMQAVLDLIEVK